MNELNIVHDDTDVHITEYGNLTTNLGGYVAAGFGSYHANISGSTLNVDFIPFIGIAATVNTIQVAISTDSVSGVSTSDLKHARLELHDWNCFRIFPWYSYSWNISNCL